MNKLKSIDMGNISLKIVVIVLGLIHLVICPCLAQNCWTATSSGAGDSMASDFVSCLTVYNGNIYAGGHFNIAGGNSAINVAKWDGSGWSSLGSGIRFSTLVNGGVRTMTVFNGELYIAGNFDTAGGIPVNNIAKWDGNTWSSVGTGLGTKTEQVFALTVYNGKLYAGGLFVDSVGMITIPAINKWDGNSWSGLAATSDFQVWALTEFNGKLYAGGQFTIFSGTDTLMNIAVLDDTTWAGLSGGIGTRFTSQAVNTLAVYNGNLYAGGVNLLNASGVPINQIGKWTGTAWSDVSGGVTGGLNPYITTLLVYNGTLLAGGSFRFADSVPASNLAQWNGSAWSDFGGGIPGVANKVSALDSVNGNLFVGGEFKQAGNINALNIAEWTCTTGISETEANSFVNIFPNPSNGFINISVQDISKKPEIELYNLMGARIYYRRLNAKTTQLDLSKEATGVYFYRINDKNGSSIGNGKFILQ